jgi:hypothetical protein
MKGLVIDIASRAPIAGAQVYLVAPNGTYLGSVSDRDGRYELELPDREQASLFCAHGEHAAFLLSNFSPPEEYTLEMQSPDGRGSVIALEGTCVVPGLRGRLNPIKDTLDRLYIYGSNISFDGQATQPFHFRVQQPFVAEDAWRKRVTLEVITMIGKQALIQFADSA